jgi:hypothetical protein
MARRDSTSKSPPSDGEARQLRDAIHLLGDYTHVDVRAQRGHLNIYAGDKLSVARLTPLGNGSYALSFHTHTGRWEPMPFSGPLPVMADTLVTVLGPHLERWDFSDWKSGSSH